MSSKIRILISNILTNDKKNQLKMDYVRKTE
jgi:hypothetical protein